MKDTKLVLSQAILWAAAILVVAMVEDQGDAVPLLAVLATMAIGLVSSRTSARENPQVAGYHPMVTL